MLQLFLDYIKQKKYTVDNFIADCCFADIDETQLDDIVDRVTMIKFKLAGSPKRTSKLAFYLNPKLWASILLLQPISTQH